MKKEKIIEKINKIIANPRISNLKYSSNIITDDKENSFWYGGFLLSYIVDNKYKVSYCAYGDNVGTIYTLENNKIVKEEYSDKLNKGFFGRILEKKGIKKDSEIYFKDCSRIPNVEKILKEKNKKAVLLQELFNWFELEIIDCKTEDCITNYNMKVLVDFKSLFFTNFELFDLIYDNYINDNI